MKARRRHDVKKGRKSRMLKAHYCPEKSAARDSIKCNFSRGIKIGNREKKEKALEEKYNLARRLLLFFRLKLS